MNRDKHQTTIGKLSFGAPESAAVLARLDVDNGIDGTVSRVAYYVDVVRKLPAEALMPCENLDALEDCSGHRLLVCGEEGRRLP